MNLLHTAPGKLLKLIEIGGFRRLIFAYSRALLYPFKQVDFKPRSSFLTIRGSTDSRWDLEFTVPVRDKRNGLGERLGERQEAQEFLVLGRREAHRNMNAIDCKLVIDKRIAHQKALFGPDDRAVINHRY
jgi:hypothetical protein